MSGDEECVAGQPGIAQRATERRQGGGRPRRDLGQVIVEEDLQIDARRLLLRGALDRVVRFGGRSGRGVWGRGDRGRRRLRRCGRWRSQPRRRAGKQQRGRLRPQVRVATERQPVLLGGAFRDTPLSLSIRSSTALASASDCTLPSVSLSVGGSAPHAGAPSASPPAAGGHATASVSSHSLSARSRQASSVGRSAHVVQRFRLAGARFHIMVSLSHLVPM